MTYSDFDAFCGSLPSATFVVQWGGSHVWKLGGKVFAIGGWGDGEPAFTFKVTPLAFEVLAHQPGLRPAPYLAARGLSWIQHFGAPGLSDEQLQDHLRQSYVLVRGKLTRKARHDLGIADDGAV